MQQHLGDERCAVINDSPAYSIAPTRDDEGRLVSAHAHVREYVDKPSLSWSSVKIAFIAIFIVVVLTALTVIGTHQIPDLMGN